MSWDPVRVLPLPFRHREVITVVWVRVCPGHRGLHKLYLNVWVWGFSGRLVVPLFCGEQPAFGLFSTHGKLVALLVRATAGGGGGGSVSQSMGRSTPGEDPHFRCPLNPAVPLILCNIDCLAAALGLKDSCSPYRSWHTLWMDWGMGGGGGTRFSIISGVFLHGSFLVPALRSSWGGALSL